MDKNIPLTSIGVKVSWAVEAVAGTRPTTGYKRIHGLFSTPDLNIAPSTADATSFDDTQFTRKIDLLPEIPDTIDYGARYGKQFKKDWDAVCDAYDTAKKSGKEIWFCEDIPDDEDSDFNNAYFYTGKPLRVKKPALEANSGIDTTAYVVYTGSYEESESPTYSEGE